MALKPDAVLVVKTGDNKNWQYSQYQHCNLEPELDSNLLMATVSNFQHAQHSKGAHSWRMLDPVQCCTRAHVKLDTYAVLKVTVLSRDLQTKPGCINAQVAV